MNVPRFPTASVADHDCWRWSALDDTTRQELWDRFVTWVDWLQIAYSPWIQLPTCWPLHEGLRIELRQFWLWHSVTLSMANVGDAVNWHYNLRLAAAEWTGSLGSCRHEDALPYQAALAETDRQRRAHFVDLARAEESSGATSGPVQGDDQQRSSLSSGDWPGGSTEEDGVSELYFGDVDEFVRDYLSQVYRRQVGPGTPRRWSGRWWTSSEAITRLEALWRAWEHLRHDPDTGMSIWFRDHADPQMAALMDPDGPFASSADRNDPDEPLPYEPVPEGLFPDLRYG